MRVNPNPTGDILAALSITQERQQDALMQLSTGRRVNQPSDDPAGAAIYTGNVAVESRIDQYLQSVASVRALNQTADSALGSMVTALNQAISLGTQAANGTMSQQDLAAIFKVVQGVLSNVVQLANTSFHGTYIFAGTASTAVPFTITPTGVTYNGNDGVNTVAIADGRTISTNIPGGQLFQQAGSSVLDSLQQLMDALQSGDKTAIGTATTAVGTSLTYLSSQRAFYGNNLNQLNGDEQALQQQNLTLKTQDNNLVGVDLAKAATDLAQAQTTHQAALAAAAKVLQPSLLDYLR
jgi:flagellar hook-associated protein 3 FlgL